MTAPYLPPQGPGWAARLFGGADPFASGLIDPQEARGLGRNALFQTGLALLQNSGPAPYKRGLGEILGTSLQQGQHAYETGVQGTLAQRQLRQQQAEQQRIAQQRQELAGMIAQNPDFNAIVPRVIAASAGGDENATKLLGALSNLRTETGRPAITYRESIDPSNGKRATAVIDERNPTQPLGYLPLAEPSDLPERRFQLTEERQDRMAANDFTRIHLDPQVRKAVRSYQQFQSHLQQAANGNQEAYKSLISAFAANADPNNQLRLGMLEFLSNLDPSVAGQARIIAERMSSGTIPKEDLRRLNEIVVHNYEESARQYQEAYDEQIARLPGTRQYIPAPTAIFRPVTPTARSSVGSALDRLRGRP